MKSLNFFFLFVVLVLFSCQKSDTPEEVNGMQPLYITKSVFNEVKSSTAKPFSKVGKIYKYGNRIFISDQGTGVHVINNSNPSAPTKEAFISIYGTSDMAVKNNTMYADNGSNLLAIDISEINNVAVSSKIEDVYENNIQLFPPGHIGYFECVDASKGYVYDWQSIKLKNPECQR